MVIQRTSNWLVGMILAAIVTAGVSPNVAVQFLSALTASCGVGALISRVLSQSELDRLEYAIYAAAEFKIQKLFVNKNEAEMS